MKTFVPVVIILFSAVFRFCITDYICLKINCISTAVLIHVCVIKQIRGSEYTGGEILDESL
jgi:hypothetical protein